MSEEKNRAGSPTIDLKPSILPEHGDVALGFLENHETAVYTREEEKAVLRKIDMVLMPLVSPIHEATGHLSHLLTHWYIENAR